MTAIANGQITPAITTSVPKAIALITHIAAAFTLSQYYRRTLFTLYVAFGG